MHKLLIVDDEKWIRQGLKEIINWKSIGIDEVYEAQDGGEAIAIIEKVFPDVMITDIRMPDINGLDLIRIMRDKYPEMKVVIISGYKDFDYAREAVALGAYSYVVKPIDENNILKIVQKCISDIEMEEKHKKELEMMENQLNESKCLVCQELIESIMKEVIDDETKALNKALMWGMDIKSDLYIIFSFSIDKIESYKKGDYGIKQYNINESTVKVINESIENFYKGMAFIGDGDIIHGFIGLDVKYTRSKILKWFNYINERIYEKLGYTITMGISKPCKSLKEWPSAKMQADISLRQKFFKGNGIIIFYEENFLEYSDNIYNYDIKNDKYILNSIKTGDSEGLLNILNKIKADILNSAHMVDYTGIKHIYEGIVEYVYREISESLRIDIESTHKEKVEAVNRISKVETLFQISDIVQELFLNWMEQILELQKGQTSKIIQEVLDYVNDNYNKKISLKTAADYVYLNSSYLSKLFSEEVGRPFTKYLMKIRVEKAKEKLQDPKLKVYEVGDMVGYSDIKYFIKVFKEIEGITPAQYRDMFFGD